MTIGHQMSAPSRTNFRVSTALGGLEARLKIDLTSRGPLGPSRRADLKVGS